MCYNLYIRLSKGDGVLSRKRITTSLDMDLYSEIKILAIKKGKNANDLLEEGMKYVLKKEKSNSQITEDNINEQIKHQEGRE